MFTVPWKFINILQSAFHVFSTHNDEDNIFKRFNDYLWSLNEQKCS